MEEPFTPVDFTSFSVTNNFKERLTDAELLMAEGSRKARYPQTLPVYLASLALYGKSMLSPIIAASPDRNYDFWDMFNDGDITGAKPSYLSVSSSEDGQVHFVVTDETKGYAVPGDILRRPQVPSNGNLLLDAQTVRSAISRYLRFSPRSLLTDPDATIIEGPTEDQPFLIVHSKSGRAVVQQEGNNGIHNVKGLIFTPKARQAGESIYGAVELW